MANIKSAKKSIRKIQRRTQVNGNRRSRIRTYIRRVEEAIIQGNSDAAVTAFREAQSEIMRGVSKGVLHANTAARKVSRLSHRVREMKPNVAYIR